MVGIHEPRELRPCRSTICLVQGAGCNLGIRGPPLVWQGEWGLRMATGHVFWWCLVNTDLSVLDETHTWCSFQVTTDFPIIISTAGEQSVEMQFMAWTTWRPGRIILLSQLRLNKHRLNRTLWTIYPNKFQHGFKKSRNLRPNGRHTSSDVSFTRLEGVERDNSSLKRCNKQPNCRYIYTSNLVPQ